MRKGSKDEVENRKCFDSRFDESGLILGGVNARLWVSLDFLLSLRRRLADPPGL